MAARSRTAVFVVLIVLASMTAELGRPRPAAAVGPTISFCFAWASTNVAYSQSPVFLYYWDVPAQNWVSVASNRGGWATTDNTGCSQFGGLTPGYYYAVRAHYLSADFFVDGWTASIYAQDGGGPVYLGLFDVTVTRFSNGWNQGNRLSTIADAERPARP